MDNQDRKVVTEGVAVPLDGRMVVPMVIRDLLDLKQGDLLEVNVVLENGKTISVIVKMQSQGRITIKKDIRERNNFKDDGQMDVTFRKREKIT